MFSINCLADPHFYQISTACFLTNFPGSANCLVLRCGAARVLSNFSWQIHTFLSNGAWKIAESADLVLQFCPNVFIIVPSASGTETSRKETEV